MKKPATRGKAKAEPTKTAKVTAPVYPFQCKARKRTIQKGECSPNPDHPACPKCQVDLYLQRQKIEKQKQQEARKQVNLQAPASAEKKAVNRTKPKPLQPAKAKPTTATTRPTRTPKSDRGGAYRLEVLDDNDFEELAKSLRMKAFSTSQEEQPESSPFNILPSQRVSQKEQLEDINRTYWVERHLFENYPRPSEIIKTLDRILELAPQVEEWTRIFEELDTWTEDLLVNAGYRSGRYQELPGKLFKGNSEDLTSQQAEAAADNIIGQEQLDLMRAFSLITTSQTNLDRTVKAAQEVRSHLTDQGGRTPELAIKNLILRLAKFFKDCTGKTATITEDRHKQVFSGNFFRFADTFFDILGRRTNDGSIPRTNSAIGNQIRRVLNQGLHKKK